MTILSSCRIRLFMGIVGLCMVLISSGCGGNSNSDSGNTSPPSNSRLTIAKSIDDRIVDSIIKMCMENIAEATGYRYVDEVTDFECLNESPYNNIRSLEGLEDYGNLRRLALVSSGLVTQVSSKPILGLEKLETLKLIKANFHMAEEFKACTLKDVEITGDVSSFVRYIGNCNFERLVLADAFEVGGGIISAPDIGHMDSLRKLVLDIWSLHDLAGLSGTTMLESLSITGTQVTDLSPLVGNVSLKRLDLHGSDDIEDLSMLASFVELDDLNINGVGGDLSFVEHLPLLKKLDISSVSRDDYSALRTARNLETLRMNSVGSLFLSDDFLPSSPLRHLDVGDSSVNMVAALWKYPDLEVLVLDGALLPINSRLLLHFKKLRVLSAMNVTLYDVELLGYIGLDGLAFSAKSGANYGDWYGMNTSPRVLVGGGFFDSPFRGTPPGVEYLMAEVIYTDSRISIGNFHKLLEKPDLKEIYLVGDAAVLENGEALGNVQLAAISAQYPGKIIERRRSFEVPSIVDIVEKQAR